MKAARTSKLLFILLLLFLVITSKAGQQGGFGNILECARQGKDCRVKLDSLIRYSAGNQKFKDHYLFLMEGSHALASQGYFELGLYTARKAFAWTSDSIWMHAKVAGRLSAIFLYAGDLDSSLFYNKQALNLFRETPDSVQVGNTLINRGQIRKELGRYPEAMKSYLEALKIYRQQKVPDKVARTQSEIAVLSAATGDVEKAIAYNKKAARHFEGTGEQETYAYIILNLANDLIYTGREDTALLLLNRAIPVFEETENLYLLMNAQAQTGRAYYRLKEYRKAIDHLNYSIEMGSGQNFMAQLAYDHEMLAAIYRELGDPSKALRHNKESYKLNKQLGINEEYKYSLHDLAETYETMGLPDSALKYYRHYMEVSDSLFSLEKSHQLDALKAEFESDLKEQEIRAGKAEISLLEERSRKETIRSIALGLGLLLVIVVAVWIVTRQRIHMRLNRKISLEKNKVLRAELDLKTEEQKHLQSELDHKKREMTTLALMMAEKNELLRSFKEQLSEISGREEGNGEMKHLIRKIERAENKKEDWDKFMAIFEEVHPAYLQNMQSEHPDLTYNDLRLLALMRMNFSNKEVAGILHVSDEGLKKARYRLRKKLHLPSGENLHEFLIQQA